MEVKWIFLAPEIKPFAQMFTLSIYKKSLKYKFPKKKKKKKVSFFILTIVFKYLVLSYWELIINYKHPNEQTWLTNKLAQLSQQYDNADILQPLDNQETKMHFVWGSREGRKSNGKYTLNGISCMRKVWVSYIFF